MSSEILKSNSSSAIQKQLVGSVLYQSNSNKQTIKTMETIVSNVLKSNNYNADTKALTGSVLSQSNKKR